MTGSLFIPNITPDFGLSAPFNLMFTFFGQFFDHGLDLVNKGGGTVFMPLQADDPLIAGPDNIARQRRRPAGRPRFMVHDARDQPARAGRRLGDTATLGRSADDIQEAINPTTPWVDQNQTYTSHPSHQVFLREYALAADGPWQTGKVLDGGSARRAAPASRRRDLQHRQLGRGQGAGARRCSASGSSTGRLQRAAAPDRPLRPLQARPARGFPQLVLPGNVLARGQPGRERRRRRRHPGQRVQDRPRVPQRHRAQRRPDSPGRHRTPDAVAGDEPASTPQPAGTYDNELLDLHFVTGDGRGNENIALTAVHTLFHAEHNRLRRTTSIGSDQHARLPDAGRSRGVARGCDAGSGWDYGERLFQAARFVTEMQYQHLVFEEFARKVVPLDQPVPRRRHQRQHQPGDLGRVRAHRSIASATRC